MHHMYSSQKGDPLCPLGFHPQVRWPTRCKRCFRDYKEHGGKKGSLRDITSSTPSLSPWESSSGRSSESSPGKRTWASATNLAKEESKSYSKFVPTPAANWTSAMDLTTIGSDPRETVTSDKHTKNIRSRSLDIDSNDLSRPSEESDKVTRPQKLQIKEVIDKSNGTTNNDVEFIIQVKKSRTVASPKSSLQDAQDALMEKGGKVDKNEIQELKSQLSEMRARYEKAEKEKSEILLRRLASVDTVSGKPSSNELIRLQKTVKEMQAKNDVLAEEKNGLSTKIKSLQKELNTKFYKSDRDKVNEELKSKLKAAETLCETLMDENEDMKKEIRELEEEIYEMQDNFREEQANEYTVLRKNLEQSNKNCRILSFKLRKIERKVEELENEKADFEKKYEQVKRIEDMLRKLGNECKNRSQKKVADFTKLQLKKIVDDLENDIGDIIGSFENLTGAKNSGVHDIKAEDNNAKYIMLLKDYEILKQKYESSEKERTTVKDKKGTQEISTESNGKKDSDLQAAKKKLEETIVASNAERKSLEEEKTKLREEKEKLKSKLLSLSAEKLKIYNEVVQLKKDLEASTSTEKNNVKMETTVSELKKEVAQEKEKNIKLREELSSYAERESKMSQTLNNVERTKSLLEEEMKRATTEFTEMKTSTTNKIANLNSEISELKKQKEKLEAQTDKDIQSKDTEIITLKKKVASLEKTGLSAKKMNEIKQTYNEKISNLQNEIKRQHQEYNELSVKYRELADLKTQLEEKNESLNSNLVDQKRDLDNIRTELDTIQNSLTAKINESQAEKSLVEARLRELEKISNEHAVTELNDEINNLKIQNSSLMKRVEDMKNLNDDLTNKLKDYQAVSKIHRNLSADTTALESEIRKLKNALSNTEKAKKADLAQCKMRYEHRITAINDEIQSIQNQLARYKRERDTYKHMLEGAQRTIAELKSVRQRRQSNTSSGKSDEDEELSGTNVAVLEKQISCLEDELSETKLEASKLKTELVSEKSAWQVKLSEMQSRINELEEERVLTSGRTKVPGLKVRMELAWQKEREEQQRLLQETATLARDLRQTLFEIERERDKERLENKRRQDQMKKVFDEEKEENKKKLIELQCDLLELRDAHAKLRTSNEKMRREKERNEKEREELREIILSKRRIEQTETKNINILLQQVDDLMKLFPELDSKENGKLDTYTPTPPRRLKSKSRESSPMLENKDKNKGEKTEKLDYTIKKLMEVAKELKESKKADDASAARLKKFGSKRSTSVDSDPGKVTMANRSKVTRLKRKSLSLEQTTGRNDESQMIWGTDSNVSSMQSLESSEADSRAFSLPRDSSVDSRLSGGSTKSEMSHREKKYGKNIIRKITTKLIKSNSLDDPNTSFDSLQTSGSEVSINERNKNEKKNLKKKLADMFKRGSRSNSVDRKGSPDTRPSSRNSMTLRT